MKIWDCFLIDSEFELLKIRCEEMKGLDVTHVLVESPVTHSGKKKPLNFEREKKWFKDYNIAHIVAEDFTMPPVYFSIEVQQRNEIKKALEMLGAKDDDTVILADVDEIPLQSVVNIFHDMKVDFAAIKMAFARYYFNTLRNDLWDRCRCFRYSYLKGRTPDEIRNSGYDNTVYSGVHLSYTGGVSEIMNKVSSFSHLEYDTPEFNSVERWMERVNKLIDPFDGSPLRVIRPDSPIMPRFIRENFRKMHKYIKL